MTQIITLFIAFVLPYSTWASSDDYFAKWIGERLEELAPHQSGAYDQFPEKTTDIAYNNTEEDNWWLDRIKEKAIQQGHATSEELEGLSVDEVEDLLGDEIFESIDQEVFNEAGKLCAKVLAEEATTDPDKEALCKSQNRLKTITLVKEALNGQKPWDTESIVHDYNVGILEAILLCTQKLLEDEEYSLTEDEAINICYDQILEKLSNDGRGSGPAGLFGHGFPLGDTLLIQKGEHFILLPSQLVLEALEKIQRHQTSIDWKDQQTRLTQITVGGVLMAGTVFFGSKLLGAVGAVFAGTAAVANDLCTPYTGAEGLQHLLDEKDLDHQIYVLSSCPIVSGQILTVSDSL